MTTTPWPRPARKPIVHVLCGLPASGKSTKARELVTAGGVLVRRVNLDDLRTMLDQPADGPRWWSNGHEHTTQGIHIAAVRALVLDGYDVVVDDTNLTPHEPARLKDAVGRIAWFTVHDLTTVPLEECIRRDTARPQPVGADVIRKLADAHAHARASGWQLTEEWMNDHHDDAVGSARWARTYRDRYGNHEPHQQEGDSAA